MMSSREFRHAKASHTTLMALALACSLAQVAQARADDIVVDFSFSAGSHHAYGELTAAPRGGDAYQIDSLTGFMEGQAMSLLEQIPATNAPGDGPVLFQSSQWTFDDLIYLNHALNVDDYGIGLQSSAVGIKLIGSATDPWTGTGPAGLFYSDDALSAGAASQALTTPWLPVTLQASVVGTIPEPAPAALFGLAGVLLLVWRQGAARGIRQA